MAPPPDHHVINKKAEHLAGSCNGTSDLPPPVVSPLLQHVRVPGAWVSTPPTFHPDLPTPLNGPSVAPNRSSMAPSEPSEPAMDPKDARRDPFYRDLVRGFSDMVLSVYRQECVPSPKPEDPRPGMFVLKKGPSKVYLEGKFLDPVLKRDQLTIEASKAEAFKFDIHDLGRPVAVLNVDFCISACSDYVAPPQDDRKIAKPVSLLQKPRERARDERNVYSRCWEVPPPPRVPFSEPANNHLERPAQEEIHEGHLCIDVERIAREFMWWFLEWRSAIPRNMDPGVGKCIEAIVFNYTRASSLFRIDYDQEHHMKQTLNNLIWELKHPCATRVGQTNPDGTTIKNPWVLGDEIIHTALGLTKAHGSTIALRLDTMMRYVQTMRHEKRPYMTKAPEDLWAMLSRAAAPYDDDPTHDDMMRFSQGKRLQNYDVDNYMSERKRRLKWDGKVEVRDAEVKEEDEDTDTGLGIDEREKLYYERRVLSEERDELAKKLKNMEETNKELNTEHGRTLKYLRDAREELKKKDEEITEAREAVKQQDEELEAQDRLRKWISEQKNPDLGALSSIGMDESPTVVHGGDHDGVMDLDG